MSKYPGIPSSINGKPNPDYVKLNSKEWAASNRDKRAQIDKNYNGRNRDKRVQASKAWRNTNKDRAKEYDDIHNVERYHILYPQYLLLLEVQNNSCANLQEKRRNLVYRS